MRLIAPTEYRRMAWKNGGGTTWEVAMHPEGSDWSTFAWRVSIAQIARDGPFSPFAGIDRALVVLEGAGMRLTGIGEDAIDVRLHDRVAFAGEAAVSSVLLDGPTRDFNVMTRRGTAHAHVSVVRDAHASMSRVATYICHAASGTCVCAVDGSQVELPEAHTVIADAARFDLDASSAAAVFVAVSA